jgi:diguanylate cyclase (GGDEF)-like protein
LFLVTALSSALRAGSETPELGRAARTWGARFSTPVEALSVLTMLRDALIALGGGAPDGRGTVSGATVNRLFDQMSMEAVDAASANLRAAARHDPLTGCANRRALDEDLPRALASAERSKLDLAVAVVDLDGLKQINDAEGHAAGDNALRSLVDALRRALREADTLYRAGGDEFVVVAPFTDAAGARALMRRAERMGAPHFSWGVAGLNQARALASEGRERRDGRPGAPARIGAGALGALALLELADADLYRRRRAARTAAAAASRRRRMTAVASVAATVTVTAGMASLAAALSSGGRSPAAPTAQAAGAGATSALPHWAAFGSGRTRHNSVGGAFLTVPAPTTTTVPPPPAPSATTTTGGPAVLTSATSAAGGAGAGGPAAAPLVQSGTPTGPGNGHGQGQGPGQNQGQGPKGGATSAGAASTLAVTSGQASGGLAGSAPGGHGNH